MKERTCIAKGCVKPIQARNLCWKHYQRLRRTGTTDRPSCGVDGCVSEAQALGLCDKHHLAYKATTDVVSRKTAPSTPKPPKSPRPHKPPETHRGDYVTVRGRGAHRIIMEHVLGRKLSPWENVHHRNGIRNDNSPDNLELWVVAQPSGQRPEDLAEWVVAKYPELVRCELNKKEA